DTLWESLDASEHAAIDQSWLRESQDRLTAYRTGELKSEDGVTTLAAIEADLGK
ncbi:MAG: putative addiction module component, partial [Verrucomicrobiota bacterium]